MAILRFRDSNGNVVEVPAIAGSDGVSPTVNVVPSSAGHVVTITDAEGEKSFTVPNGANGEKGEGFSISKTYESVAEMKAGFATDGVAEGGFVLIAAGSVDDVDNAKLYVKGATAYRYLCDLSGSQGIKGEPGSSIKSITRSGTSGLVDTYTVTLTDGSTAIFTVKNGADGADGADGVDGKDGVSPTVSTHETSTGHMVEITDANGVQSFEVLNGKDGEGGGGETLFSTLLFRGQMGYVIYYDDQRYLHDTVQLADEILPNTTYVINGERYTSDENGEIFISGLYNDPFLYDLTLSGRTMTFSSEDIDPYWSDNESEIGVGITVTGPSAMACVAATMLADLDYMGESTGSVNLNFKPLAHSTLYFTLQSYNTINETVKAVTLDGDGLLIETEVATVGGVSVYATITSGALKWRAEGGTYACTLYVTTEAGNVTNVTASSGSSGSSGGAPMIYVTDTYTSLFEADPSKVYYIKFYDPTDSHSKVCWIVDGGSVREYGNNYYNFDATMEGGCYVSVNPRGCTVVVEVYEISNYQISCFIEGTKVLLRDPVSKELYEKSIEDVQPFEYAAWWNPAKGRLDGTRVLAPPIVGDAVEYDRVYFSDGTVLNVYGIQLFWDVDKDDLIDWAKMVPGTRVCTKDGDIVEFVRSEHVVPETPLKHYTLLTFRGRYIAEGIQAADKRDLILPRLKRPEHIKYWRMLNEADRRNLEKAWREGMKRRNWKHSKELYDALEPYRTEKKALAATVSEKKQYLLDTDHKVIKYTEGVIGEDEFAPFKAARQLARDDVNAAEDRLATLETEMADVTERVRLEIKSTYVPKYAGKFAGKTKVILD